MNNKNQYHKYINNVNNYNNYYNNNYYTNGYGYKKQYSKNNNNNMNNSMNNYNEDRKKNNYYNNYFTEGHNDYLYSQNTRKKKGNRYNNNNYENNKYYENNEEEMISKSVNENKEKMELMKIQMHLRDGQCKDLVVNKDDDINSLVKQFCTDNFINDNLVEPLINKIKQSLVKLNIVNNCVELNRDGVVMLEKAKKMLKHK